MKTISLKMWSKVKIIPDKFSWVQCGFLALIWLKGGQGMCAVVMVFAV